MQKLPFVLLFITLLSVGVPPAAGKYNIGFVLAERQSYITTYLTELLDVFETFWTDVFNAPVIMDALSNNVTMGNLTGLDAVIAWSGYNTGFLNNKALGDLLAEYMDNGGGIVVAFLGNAIEPKTPERTIEGAFSAYRVFEPAAVDGQKQFFDPSRVYWPEHPVMKGVTNITLFEGFTNGVNLTSGSYALARATKGSIIAAVKDSLGPAKKNRVDLGLYPEDSIYYSVDVVTYVQLMGQALLYTINGSFEQIPLNNSLSCIAPNFTAILSTYNLHPSAVVTQSIPVGTSLPDGTLQLNVTVSISGSGTFTRTVTITCVNSGGGDLWSHSIMALFANWLDLNKSLLL